MFGGYLNLVMSLLFLDLGLSQQIERNLTNSHQIVRQRLLEDALLPCNSSNGNDLELIEWWYKRIGGVYIGAFNATSSRVRAMLVAMEKYGQKHMESLHEGYNRRMSTFRENYHTQVETIRNSYFESADRFRDYRQAQMDNVQQHLDVYYQQISRLREFGHKRVEHLWESYEKSVNAVRTFTLEQRLKILNQYKIKQRYVNKLLEAIGTETNMDIISRKEAAIRAVLGEEQPPPIWSSHPSNHSFNNLFNNSNKENRLRRSASYHSLPDFPLVDETPEGIYVNKFNEFSEFSEKNLKNKEEEEEDFLLALQPSTSTASSLPLYNNKIQTTGLN
uniref:Uncharacterized protein n=1 Tax=Meloidogyne hapla TaxID=6305 RepID=A0A1I8AZZ6_MELHA